jgi:hypothetical protein
VDIARRSSPEEEELDAKRDECSKLQAELAERELDLVNLRASLAAFEDKYLRQVGTLYAELDDWNAKIAAQLADEEGTENACAAASAAAAQAAESVYAGSRVPHAFPATPCLLLHSAANSCKNEVLLWTFLWTCLRILP